MHNALVRQYALVLVEKLPDDCDRSETSIYAEFQGLQQPPQRIKTTELWQCFYSNQSFRVVQAPDPEFTQPFTVVWNGWRLPFCETFLLEKAITYCDLCAENIPEMSQPDFIPAKLTRNDKARIKEQIARIWKRLTLEYPELED